MAVTGYRPGTSELNYQLNAGVFLKNFDYTTPTTLEALLTALNTAISNGTGLLGATSGGGSFQATPTMRTIEVDGQRGAGKGSTVNDGWEIMLTGTLREITAENFKDALMSADIDSTVAKIKKVTIRNEVALADYIDSLVWFGDKGDGGLIMIAIDNALNLTGANFTFADKGEGSLPFEFKAHQVGAASAAPCRIFLFDATTTTPEG